MPSCVVKNCKNNSKAHKKYHGVTFHLFPINNEIIIKWIVAIRKSRNDPEWLPSKTSVVCSDHFDNKDLYITTRGLRRVTRSGYPKELSSESILCTECMVLLRERANTCIDEGSDSSLPAFGHRSICYPCGISILRVTRTHPVRSGRREKDILLRKVPLHLASRLEKVCGACWCAAYREAKHQNDSDRSVLSDVGTCGEPNIPATLPQITSQPSLLEHDMENYIKYKIMGSVKRIQLKPNCIPSRFDENIKHKASSNECHLAEAKRLRISEDSVQDFKEEYDVKVSSSCFKDSQTTLGVSSVENKCDTAVQFIQIQRLSDPSEANSKDADDLESSSDEADQDAEQSISSGNEDTCYPQSDAPVAHTAERIQEDPTKAFIVKVFHYLEHEFEVLKKMDAKMILINLSKLQYRTAMATGVSETTVLEILREEARQNAAMRESGPQNDGKPEAAAVNAGKPQRPAQKRRRVCKKQSLAESSSEATDGSIEEVGHSSVAQDITIEPEGEMLVVKAEPFEYYNDEPAINIEPVNATAINKKQAQKDPISLDVKPESPDDDEMNDTNETLAVQPSSSKRRRILRKSDVASTHYQDQIDPVSSDVKVEPPDGEMNVQRTQAQYTTGASSSHRRVIELDGQRTQAQYTTGVSSSHRRVIELDGRSLLRVGEVKVKRESDEEGFS